MNLHRFRSQTGTLAGSRRSVTIGLTGAWLLLLAAPQVGVAASPTQRGVTQTVRTGPDVDRYRDMVLADDPVGYWQLNELLGTTADDVTGANDGTYRGAPILGLPGIVTYPGNLSPDMEGTDDRVTANSMASGISWSRGFTLEAWVHVTQRSVEEDAISFNTSTGANRPGLLRDEPSDKFKYRDGDPGSGDYHYALSTTVPVVGGSYYIVATVDGQNHGNLYVNGDQEASFTTPARPPSNGGLFSIGAEYDAGPTPEAFWHGPLDEAAVYNYALSATRVKAHWLGVPATCPGFAGDSRTQVVGTAGADVLVGTSGPDIICGLEGNDVLKGMGGNDLLLGGPGADSTYGGTGNDVFDGGTEPDTAFFSEAPVASAVTADLSGVAAVCAGIPCADNAELGHDTFVKDPVTGFSSTESLIGTRFNDVLTGDGGRNMLYGASGNDTLHGGGGNDLLLPGAGDDSVVSGDAGIDALIYSDIATGGVNIDLPSATATGTLSGGAGADSFSNFEIYFGSYQADVVTGSPEADLIYGLGGADRIFGRGGFDLIGGGPGADVIDGGPGVDTATYWSAPGGSNVDLSAGTAVDGTGSTDSLSSVEDVLGSNLGNDSISGSSGANVLYGFGGNDTLSGLTGDDVLDGGSGTDTLDGGSGNDTCISGEIYRHCQTVKTAQVTSSPDSVIRTVKMEARAELDIDRIADLAFG